MKWKLFLLLFYVIPFHAKWTGTFFFFCFLLQGCATMCFREKKAKKRLQWCCNVNQQIPFFRQLVSKSTFDLVCVCIFGIHLISSPFLICNATVHFYWSCCLKGEDSLMINILIISIIIFKSSLFFL